MRCRHAVGLDIDADQYAIEGAYEAYKCWRASYRKPENEVDDPIKPTHNLLAQQA